jgi:hypothetical protein
MDRQHVAIASLVRRATDRDGAVSRAALASKPRG